MKQLILMRHAPYGEDDRISPQGIEITLNIAPRIFREIHGDKILLLSSTAPRAMDTSKILVDHIAALKPDVVREDHEELWSDNEHYPNNRVVEALVNSKKDNFDTIILVTHLEYAENFLQHYFGRELLFSALSSPQKGEAVSVDIQQMTWKKV